LGIVRRRGLLQVGIIVGSLLGMSWATPSQQGGQSKVAGKAAAPSTGKAVATPKVDWTIFLPEGEGKFQTSVYCINCHELQVIVAGKRSDEAGWAQIIQRMVSMNGAQIEPDDGAVISKYLASAFGPSTPKLELPIHINTAPKETLALLSNLSPTDVQAIIDARTKEKLQDFAALEAAVGNDKIAKYKSSISFD
jgi:DNA uptake protein ComE-like DNA-binding protein